MTSYGGFTCRILTMVCVLVGSGSVCIMMRPILLASCLNSGVELSMRCECRFALKGGPLRGDKQRETGVLLRAYDGLFVVIIWGCGISKVCPFSDAESIISRMIAGEEKMVICGTSTWASEGIPSAFFLSSLLSFLSSLPLTLSFSRDLSRLRF